MRGSYLRVFLGSWALAASCAASEASRQAVQEGIGALERKSYESALASFSKAAAADPRDGAAFFYKGFALNQLGRSNEALAALAEAQALGGGHADLPFEQGRSLFRLGRWYEAAQMMERYEEAVPGRASTSLYLGRAYFFLGDLTRAERNFKEAIRRDPSLAASLAEFLALVDRYRADPAWGHRLTAYLRREITGEKELTEEEEIAAALAALKAAAPVEGHSTLNATVHIEGGYNSNAIVLGVGRELPQGVPQKHAFFARESLTLRHAWAMRAGAGASLAYTYTRTDFETLDEIAQDDNLLTFDLRRRFGEHFGAAVRATERYTQVDRSGFWNHVALRPSAAFWHAGDAVAELSWEHARLSYFPSVAEALDRDGASDTLALTEYLTMFQGKVKPRAGVSLGRNRTDGSDFDSKVFTAWAGAALPLPGEITVDVAYAASRERFDHPNTLHDPAFGERRKDTVEFVDLQMRRPSWRGAEGSIRYTLTDTGSNVGIYQYDQSIYSFSIDVTF